MSERMAKAGSAKLVATETEVEAAIRALSPADLLRLEKFARWRVRELGRRARAGRNHVDLLGEAIIATLDTERRSWKLGSVDFVWHLISTMRSLSSHWGEGRSVLVPASSLEREDAEGQLPNVLETASSEQPGVDELLESAEELQAMKCTVEAIARMFEQDKVVSEIIEGIKVGMAGPAIREVLGLTQTEYETAMKRLRRKVRKELDGSGGHG